MTLFFGWLACHRADPPAPADPCGAGVPAAPIPRQIRLLTRHEYDLTVADLLPQLAGGAVCAADADCDSESESCVGGTCQADPCSLHTFAIKSDGHEQTVAVAGSFNAWSPSAWPMTYDPDQGEWFVKQVLPDGDYAYKFVIDGSTWVQDPLNAVSEPDGYGGQNSVLHQDCSQALAPPGFEPSSSFPVESPPSGFPFLDAAETGLVTSVHAEQYGEAAASLASQAVVDLPGLLGCASPSEDCVEPWVVAFGRRAFRRPLTSDEVDRYTSLVHSQPALADGVSAALQAMLQSPFLLYRTEVGHPVDGGYELDGTEIASAMSYLLWQAPPDEALLALGEQGKLADPDVRAEQASRLLADPRARATFREFAAQWLDVASVPTLVRVDPAFGPSLGAAMVDEVQHVVESTMFDGSGQVRDLLLTSEGYVTPELGSLYGVSGDGEVTLPPERVGLLGLAAIQTATSHSDQSSPIRRGLFVRERLLCEALPTPPPNVGPVPAVEPDATTRDRFAQHTADPFCASCHTRIDPVGFGLEGFDEIGRARAEEYGLPIDTTGWVADLDGVDEVPFDGEPELAAILADSPTVRRCFATEAFRFAAGRLETDAQECSIEAVDRAAGGDLQQVLIELVRSADFVRRAP